MAEKILKEPVEKAKVAAQSWYDQESAAIQASIDEMSSQISDIVDKYSDPGTYKTMATDILNSAYEAVLAAYTTMSTKVVTLYNSVLAQIAKIQAIFPGTGSGIGGQIAQIVNIKTAIKFIKTKIEAITTIITSITNLINEAIALATDIIDTVVNVGVGILKDIESKVQQVIDEVLTAPTKLLETHVQKAITRANDNIAKIDIAEEIVELTTGRKPGEQEYVTSCFAFGGKETNDQEAVEKISALANVPKGSRSGG